MTLLASDYIDGRLRWRKRLSVWMHLMLCPPCRGFMANFRLAVQVLQGQTPPEIQPETLEQFDRAVREALERRLSEKSGKSGPRSDKH
ncbi:MAG: zf-HC2 domain-containing protein [Oleiphilaceae bacterium]|nr:zf-HC2 domain-containing protein [Oleiphilaceae bacterium]